MPKIFVTCSLALGVLMHAAGPARAGLSDALGACRAPSVVGEALEADLDRPSDEIMGRAARLETKAKLAACVGRAVVAEWPGNVGMRTIRRDSKFDRYTGELALFVGLLEGDSLSVRESVLLEVLLEVQDLDGDAQLAANADSPSDFFELFVRYLSFKAQMARDEATRLAALMNGRP